MTCDYNAEHVRANEIRENKVSHDLGLVRQIEDLVVASSGSSPHSSAAEDGI